MSAPKLHRFLDIIAFLAGRRVPVTVDALLDGVPSYAERWREADEKGRTSVRRMFERDKEELRGLGIPIETVEDRGSGETGYRLAARDFYLPYLRLLDDAAESGNPGDARGASSAPTFEVPADEVGAALEGLLHLRDLPDFPLAAEARSAYRKLTFDLDSFRFRATPIVLLPSGGASVKESMSIVTDALLGGTRVSFDYRGMRRDERTRREVDPFGLLFKRGQWYLVGHDALRDDVRVFRLSRMEGAVAGRKDQIRERPSPEALDLEAWAGREAWELAWRDEESPVTAFVRFAAARARWAERNGYGEKVRDEADPSARTFEVLDPIPFVSWILSLEGEGELTDPAEFRAEVCAAAERVIRLHGGSP